jgi:hypothetical protein
MFWGICVCVNIRFRALLGGLFLPLKRSTGHSGNAMSLIEMVRRRLDGRCGSATIWMRRKPATIRIGNWCRGNWDHDRVDCRRQTLDGDRSDLFGQLPYTDPVTCNRIGRQYLAPSIVITNSLCYSAAEFFAAGFQDHGGIVLGVDRATGGANVRTHEEPRRYFRKDRRSPFKTLPNQADLRVAFRRSVRVGPATAGNDVEDFGITPDHFHVMTRNDLLRRNVDLINHAATLLAALGAAHARC